MVAAGSLLARAFLQQSSSLDWNREHISNAALGLDDPWRAGVPLQLAPQAQDLDIDAPLEDILVHARRPQQVLAAERALRRLQEGDEKRILAFGQRHQSAVGGGESPGPEVESPAAKMTTAALRIARLYGASGVEPSQHSADAGEQFP